MDNGYYKIYIKYGSKTFAPYKREYEDDFATKDIDVLKEEYLKLIEQYPTSQIKLVHELDPKITLDIDDCLNK